MVSKELYRKEVKELTQLLRTTWRDVQEILKNKGLDCNKTYLLGFVESENDTASGLFYTENSELLRFEKFRDNINTEIVSLKNIEEEFPQVVVLDEINNLN